MSSIAAAAARRAVLRRSFATPTRRTFASQAEDAGLEKGAKRDPELYILLAVTTGMFGVAGWYFGGKPTSTTSETNVRVAQEAMPWNVEGAEDKEYKYQYHPHGDKSKPLKNAPSALNTVIVPNVTLPKSLHDQFNKYGKDDY
ncbi:hypothetical protein FQN54_004437 [Arachnomyces sp. PD_36]|nr:hypothetical protein FQN54_004437 [Arachnomyces sp. PD_36]